MQGENGEYTEQLEKPVCAGTKPSLGNEHVDPSSDTRVALHTSPPPEQASQCWQSCHQVWCLSIPSYR